MRTRRFLVVCLTIALLAMVAVLPVSSDRGPNREVVDGLTITEVSSETEALEAEQIWTKEAMAAAQPLPMPEVNLDALLAQADGAALEEWGEPGFAPGGLPAPEADMDAQGMFPEEWAEMAEAESFIDSSTDEPTGTSNVYTTYKGNTYSQFWKYYPWRTVGTLYFKNAAGSSFRCSASVMGPNNVVVTAAHCLYDTGPNQWYRSHSFVPAYRSGTRPYGTWYPASKTILTAYASSPSWNAAIRYDVGLIKLKTNASGQKVSYYTGYLGRSWNYGYTENQTEIGYPGNLYLGDSRSWISHAETWYGGTDLLRYGSNMGSGASGSPLLRKYFPYASGANNYVNAVQSGSSPNGTSPVENIGPRFSSSNIVPLCTAVGC